MQSPLPGEALSRSLPAASAGSAAISSATVRFRISTCHELAQGTPRAIPGVGGETLLYLCWSFVSASLHDRGRRGWFIGAAGASERHPHHDQDQDRKGNQCAQERG